MMKDNGEIRGDVMKSEENVVKINTIEEVRGVKERVENRGNNGFNEVVQEECRNKDVIGNNESMSVNIETERIDNEVANETKEKADREGSVNQAKDMNCCSDYQDTVKPKQKEGSNKSYVSKLIHNLNLKENDLFYMPTTVNEKGNKVVIFKEELVEEGCQKWKLTICGYFVGCRMSVNELKYNIRIMWGQIKLLNVPLEAWSVKGISTISSRLGRPIKMDKITVDMCKEGSGRLGFSRVLVEINAEDEFLKKVEISYVDELKNVKRTKWVKVEYTWKPYRCSHCCAFGRSVQYCKMKPKIEETTHKAGNDQMKNGINEEGFVEVKNKRDASDNKKGYYGTKGNKHQVRQDVGVKYVAKPYWKSLSK
ncbi:RNA-directed DNA polymerase, eukaryota, reverse transcriptase zinc-binding domain protein [Tanacetum coccineum]|uniref:RNA-directed DNA polymerase, eukaryota, reverse transcriptase zinc-binding domain protein n=1 Tax=Tanacetum coccineum TaxID=301880 RepID=A0ABQ5FJF4_9ASTR